MSHNFPQDSLRAKFGGSGENYYYCPPNKKICVWEISGGKLTFVGPPEHRNLFGGFPEGINFCQSPNIEIGVQGDLDYSPGQSLLVRRDLS